MLEVVEIQQVIMNVETTNMRKALVTGASGHLGSRLVRKLDQQGWSVFALSSQDSFTSLPRVKHIPHKWDESLSIDIPEVDVVFHLAAQTSAYGARNNVTADISSNLIATVELLEKIVQLQSNPFIIFTGSMTEYGMTSEHPIDERVPLNPQTFYECAKIATQIYAEQFVREGWLSKSITLRLPNVYGDISKEQRVDRGFLDRSMVKALAGETLTYFGSGDYVRDFLHIDDVISALITAANYARDLKLNAYNLGTGKGTTIKEALRIIATQAQELTGVPVSITHSEFPIDAYEIEKRNSIANAESFRVATGWKPTTYFEEGVRQTLAGSWGK